MFPDPAPHVNSPSRRALDVLLFDLPRRVRKVSVVGGKPKPVTDYRSFSVTLDYPAVSGDGKKIFFTRIDKAGDIYILEHTPR